MAKRLLAIDVSNQAYKAAATNAHLSYDGCFTGGLYGFIMAVQKAIKVARINSIVLCMDSKPYLRSATYSQYKLLRNDTKDPELVKKVKATISQIRAMATILGWPVWEHAGFESDDLIGHSLTQHRGRYESIVAMSNDSDLFQLFKYRQFSVYKGSAGLYTREDFDEEFEMLDPDTVPTFLALTGTHNEIEGIAGVGPKRARKIVEDTRLLRTVRSEHGDLIDRNIELITLPHGKFDKSIGIPKLGVQSFQERNFIRFCAMYNISVVQSACDAFSSIRY